MLRYSTQSESILIDKFRDKFENLAAKVAIEQGFSYSAVQQFQYAAKEAGMQGGEQMGIMHKVKLNIDFTKLAKIASVMNKTRVSEYLIQHEKQIVKKIPFLLEVS